MPVQRARARVYADGSAVVETGTQEFGTGVATLMTQVGADALGVALEACASQAGDTDLPNTSAAVGSAGAHGQRGGARAPATALREQLVALAIADDGSPLHGADPAAVEVQDGRMRCASRPEPARRTASCCSATASPTPRRSAAGARRRSTRRTGC